VFQEVDCCFEKQEAWIEGQAMSWWGNSLWGPRKLPTVGAAFVPNQQSLAGMEKVKEGSFSPLLPPSSSTRFSQDGSKHREGLCWGKRPEPCEEGKDQGVTETACTAAPALGNGPGTDPGPLRCHQLGSGLRKSTGAHAPSTDPHSQVPGFTSHKSHRSK